VHESHSRLRELDGLRGLAALSVLLCHASSLGFPSGVWADGAAAVGLFFVLSGFVLARSLLSHPQSYAQFVRRRFLRLYPTYWATLLLSLLLMATYNPAGLESLPGLQIWTKAVSLEQIIKHLFLITPSIDVHRLDFPIWSLVVEMRISLLFPFLLAGFVWLRPPLRFAALAISPVLAFVPLFLLGIGHVPMFLLGIALAVYVPASRRPAWIAGRLFLIGAGLYSAPHFLALGYPTGDYMSAVGAAAVIVAVMSSPLAKRLLSLPPIRFLGDISYSFYLVHLPVLVFVTSWVFPATHSGAICLLAGAIATLLVAAAFREFIEVPAMRRARPLWEAPEARYRSPAPARP
jgi:peptidoglycan/LPS O-acetylase OafA/YrhL